jgi:hypothetical protein
VLYVVFTCLTIISGSANHVIPHKGFNLSHLPFSGFLNRRGGYGLGHSRKHPYLPHRRNWKLTPLPPSDVLIHLLLSETIFSPLPLRTAEISSVGGVWFFSGTTH